MVIVAIIGTSGRDKSQIYTRELFDKMVNATKWMLNNLTDVILISGGAAWADHIAVRLYLEGYTSSLILHLPCEWDEFQFHNTGNNDWRSNPGKVANYYHSKFSEVIGTSSLNHISQAINKGAEIHVHNGFHARNGYVAKCDLLIAFTWSPSDIPANGGTLDTWNKCKTKKYHVSLTKL